VAILPHVRVTPIPCLADNYAYLVETDAGQVAVVDPSEAPPVQSALQARGLGLDAIWLTHHHWDHVGGVEALCEAYRPADVLGSAHDLEHGRIPHQTRGLTEGDTLRFGGHEITLYDIPGHTLGAIAYVIEGHLFSGDTLFIAGCGRVFEGTMPMMQQSLSKLRALPPETLVCCGHEYTVANLRFAQSVEPDSTAIEARARAAKACREGGELTVPDRLGAELDTNPFLRWDAPAVIAYAEARGADGDDPGSVFGAVRAAKDAFR